MGDRAEVSHQTRTSDDHALGLGYRMGDSYTRPQRTSTGLGPVRLLRRAPHLRCGAACLCRWPARGCWEEGVPAAGGAVSRVAGVRVHTHGRGLRRGRVHSARPGTCRRGRGHLCAAGDVRRRRGRESCPRTRGLSPPGADGTWPRGMSPPASEAQSSVVTTEACNRHQSRRPPARNCRESGWKMWDASGPHPHKRPMGDKPDLFLVHLRSVQGSGILRENRSTSYSRRRISDRSGRPSVAFHQSNRQGRSRAPSSGQVWDDVPRGDQGSPGR